MMILTRSNGRKEKRLRVCKVMTVLILFVQIAVLGTKIGEIKVFLCSKNEVLEARIEVLSH